MTEQHRPDALYETVDGRYGKIRFFAKDPVVGKALRLYGEWAQIEIEYFEKLIPHGGTVLDIGGFVGTHALAFAHFVGPHGKVYTFEPQATSFELLSENLAANGASQVVARRAAVGKELATIELPALKIESVFNFGSYSVHSDDGTDADSNMFSVDLIKVDQLNLSRCDFMKIDVEGMESEVIDGGASVINRFQPIIYAECNSVDAGARVLRSLQALGYKTYLHVTETFNKNNLKGCAENIFGICKEAGLLGFPPQLNHLARRFTSPSWVIYDIETLDDLVYGMLQKPQYGDEVLRVSAAAKAGGVVVQEAVHNAALEQNRVLAGELQTLLDRQNSDNDALRAARDDALRAQAAHHTALEQNKALAAELRKEKYARAQDRDSFARERETLRAAQQILQGQADDLTRIKRSNVYRAFRKVIREEMRLRDKIRKRKRELLEKTKSAFRKKRKTEDAWLTPAPAARVASSPPAAPAPLELLNVSLIAGSQRARERSERPLLLCLSHVAPWPPRAGNEYRIFRVLKWAQSIGYDLAVVLCPLPGEELTQEAETALAGVYDNLLIVHRRGLIRYAVARDDLAEAVDALNNRKPRQFGGIDGHVNERAGAKLKQILDTFAPDPVLELIQEIDQRKIPKVYWINYGFMSRAIRVIKSNALTAIDTHDVFSTKAAKVTRFGIYDDLCITADEERLLLSRADIIVAIQPDEARELESIIPDARVVTAGVDIERTGAIAPPVVAPVVLLVASANPMNVKGLNDFLRFAWPRIRRAIPEAELHVVGAVGQHLTGAEPGVINLGFVDNLQEAYDGARLVINPAVAGTGLKIKTLEAIMQLKPIVLWPLGVEGISLALRDYCHCVRDWFAFGETVIKLLQDETATQRLYANREQIAQLLSPDHVYQDLKRVFNEHTV